VAPPDAKPPWRERDAREREQMQRWVEAKLDAIMAESDAAFLTAAAEFSRLSPRRRSAFLKKAETFRNKTPRDVARRNALLDAAEHGDIAPLRQEVAKLDPRYGRFVNLPRLHRGQHFKNRPPPTHDLTTPHGRLKEALHERPLIRAIWKQHYDGKVNRPKGQLTADEILAARWDLTPEEIRRGRLSRRRLRSGR
jgi:hypothetical protein